MSVRILVPVDGTPASKRGLDMAARVAGVYKAHVTVVHVFDTQSLDYKMIPDFQVEMVRERAREAAEELLADRVAQLAALGVEAEQKLLEGSAPKMLCREAGEGYDFIVFGSKVHSDLYDLFQGSVASELVHDCPKPLLVVKDGGEAPTEIGTGTLRILVAVDPSDASQRALTFLRGLEGAAGVELMLLHVVDPIRVGAGQSQAEARFERMGEAVREGQAMLDERAVVLKQAGYVVKTEVLEGNAADLICRICKEDRFDFVVVGKAQFGPLKERVVKTVTHELFHRCPGHQMIVP